MVSRTRVLLHSRMSLRDLITSVAAAAALLLSACSRGGDNDIRVEHTPKDDPAPVVANLTPAPADASSLPGLSLPASTDSLPPGHPPIAASSTGAPPLSMPGGSTKSAHPGKAEFSPANPTPKWSPPADWVADPPNPVRKGSWTIPAPAGSPASAATEIYVSVFQGQLAGLLANVNRWRGQVGLEPNLTDATLSTCVTNITIGGLPAQLITLDGPAGQSLEGALIFLPDRVWTFRLSGPTAAVTAQRPAFRAFLDSVQWPN